MYLVIVILVLCVAILVLAFLSYGRSWCDIGASIGVCGTAVILGLFIPLLAVTTNIEDKYDWYMETRIKYAEAEGIEKMYLEMTDVMTYNLWYEKNKEDLENPWNFKSAAGCEFDYIKIKGETNND